MRGLEMQLNYDELLPQVRRPMRGLETVGRDNKNQSRVRRPMRGLEIEINFTHKLD